MMTMDDLRAVYKAFPEDVAQRWNVENGDAGAVTAEAVLGKKRPGCSKRRRAGAGDGTAKGRGEQTEGGWYASFVLNKSDALDAALARMPFEAPRALSGSRVRHTSNAWFFFGQNPSREPLRGRPEHTDRVSHSGTWHAQQSGAKLWRVRPDENASWPSPAPRCREPLSARVEAGDLLIINTALWYHETSLPQGTGEASFSVARDFHLDLGEAGGSEAEEEDSVDMDNCNDTWATDEIPAGTVVAQGDAVMSFPLSDQPNCVLENGSRGTPSRVVSLRHIRAGESLSLPQNDSSSLHLR
uniref:U3 small nucleolar RNA-associated protein 6 n=1 Tax=Tetraselmis sp. GSL018 TaxID=582737 RepID=A0A061QKQ2_9CHLO